MTAQPYHKKLARLLDLMGGLYTVQDILSAIAAGKMQSFVVNNSWMITQIEDYPRVRQLLLVAYVGDLADTDAMHVKLIDYAREINASLIATYGRMGWLREGTLLRHGWRLKAKGQLYHKEM